MRHNSKPRNRVAALGIDVGGTKTLCLLVDKHCKILKAVKFKTAPQEGRAEFTSNLLETVKGLAETAEARNLRLVAIGLACAGSVDEKTGRIVASPNLLVLEDYPILSHLRGVTEAALTLGNDVQMAIHGEHNLGAAKGCSQVLGVFFGTGVGGAAILNGQLYTGATGRGGQIGNVLAQPVGGREAALSHGIVDRIASKAAIAGEALVMAVKEWAPYLHKHVGTDLAKVTWGLLRKAVKHGDRRIEEMLRARMRVVGLALSNIVNFLDPEVLILGGGLVEEMPRLVLDELGAGLREHLVAEISKNLRVRPAKLKNSAGALGAAHWALRNWRKDK